MQKMVLIFVLLTLQNGLLLAQQTREEKLAQLRQREDIKVTEVEKNILEIEYPNGRTILKNIGEYQPPNPYSQPTYSPTFDSTIIDLRTIDTTLYYQKYSFWQEVSIANFPYVLVEDFNKNGRPELYGFTKDDYTSEYGDITIKEMNDYEGFDSVFTYENTSRARSIYDIDKDGEPELHLIRSESDTILNWWVFRQMYYKKPTDTSLATDLSLIFEAEDTSNQADDHRYGDLDGDDKTDMIFINPSVLNYVGVYEYNEFINNFDSVYQYNYFNIDQWFQGFAVGDFDMDAKPEFFMGSIHGNVVGFESTGDNEYHISWQGEVSTNNAYLFVETDDIDGNGKTEFWVGGDAYYNDVGVTRFTIFEADGNDNYVAVGRVDLIGIFSFFAGNMQALDVDDDGKQEIMICIDQTVLMLKFNGSENHQTYEVYYIHFNELALNGINSVYYGAGMSDLDDDGKEEILITMDDDPPGLGTIRFFTFVYKPDTVTYVNFDQEQPVDFYLFQNYPNPFNSETIITFTVSYNSNVAVSVYNVLGKEITTLLEKELTPGSYTISWDGKDRNGTVLPSGVYLIRFTADRYTKTIKAVLLK